VGAGSSSHQGASFAVWEKYSGIGVAMAAWRRDQSGQAVGCKSCPGAISEQSFQTEAGHRQRLSRPKPVIGSGDYNPINNKK